RSYFEVVACLSNDYAQLFSYSGSHTDKHVHEHEVYVVGDSGPGLRPPTLIQYEGPSASGLGQRIKQSWESVQEQVQVRLQKHVGARWPMVASLGGVLVVTGIIAVAAALNEPDGSVEAPAAELALQGGETPAGATP